MHADQELFEKFQQETMDTQEMIDFLSHLENCSFCLNELANIQECRAPSPAPSYLKEQILTRAMDPDVQTVKAVHNTSRRMELLFYSLRTAAGVAAALVLLFSINRINSSDLFSPVSRQKHFQETTESIDWTKQEERQTDIYDFSQSISSGLADSMNGVTDSLNGFTNILINGGK